MKPIQKESDAHILIVDDEKDFRELLAEIISRSGYVVHTAANGFEAINSFQKIDFDVALIDFLMPKMNGLELMKELKRLDRDIEVIFITGQGSIESAVNAMKEGAYDYITKPIQFEEVENLLKRLLENRRLISENRQLKKVLRQKYTFQNIIANSPAMMDVVKKMESASQNQQPVLLQGEIGTGKEFIAKTIHFNSDRASKVFMPQDCSALSEDFLIDEWVGRELTHQQKSYAKKGIFRLATKGTVFLKEISTLTKKAQKTLSQILQSNQIIPRESKMPYSVDVRIITASQHDLIDLVKKGSFESELFILLNRINIKLPPLRERKEDIPVLLEDFLNEKRPNEVIRFAPETINLLKAFNWPQNLWELKNVVEHSISVHEGDEIIPNYLPEYLLKEISQRANRNLKSLQEIEREAIKNTLQYCQGNMKKSANILQISPKTLYRKIKKYQIKKTF